MRIFPKRTIFFMMFFCVLYFCSFLRVHAETNVSSDITNDTTWTIENSPYIISGQINIAQNTTLTINSGVVVLFDYESEIDVAGTIIGNGVSNNKIFFTSIEDTDLNGTNTTDSSDSDNLNIPPIVGDYNGLVFLDGSSGVFQNIEMRYSQIGMYSSNASLNISDSLFTKNYIPLLLDYNTLFTHSNNNFNQNTKNAIEMYGLVGPKTKLSFDNVPYFLMNDIGIDDGEITIDSGVVLNSGDGMSKTINIYNNSHLSALGTQDKKIIFDNIQLIVFNDSVATVSNSEIKNIDSPITVSNRSSFSLSDSSITNILYGFILSNSSTADIENCNFDNIKFSGSGLYAFDSAVLKINNTTISGAYYGIVASGNISINSDTLNLIGGMNGMLLSDGVNLDANKLKIKNCLDTGITTFDHFDNQDQNGHYIIYPNNSLNLNKSEIYENLYGIYDYNNTDINIKNSSISKNHTNSIYINTTDVYDGDILVFKNTGQTIDLQRNWWGDISGPYNVASNPTGIGNLISDNTNFIPWLKRDPAIPQKTPVLIVPGVLGTEISMETESGPEKLWLDLAHNLTDIGDEFMDSLQFNDNLVPWEDKLNIENVLGRKTIDVGVGTATVFNYTYGLIGELENQGYLEDTDIFTFPYDWRYGVSEENINKLKEKITDILNETGSDKVDIVAHSTGGLLVKKYVMENPSENHINKAIFVGVPNTGAPKAIKVLLQGDNFGNLFLSDDEMKKIAKNLPVVYDLLPSEEYYKDNGSFIKIIEENLFKSKSYDLNFSDMDNFLVDHKLNSKAWNNSKNLHTSDFDNFDMRTAGVDLYSISGCRAGTFGKLVEVKSKDIFGNDIPPTHNTPEEIPGDGTVPFISATNLPINQEKKFYALKSSHGEMLSEEGIRQEIVNILSQSNLSTSGIITQDISKCELNGRMISIYSPLSISITDQNNNHTGISSDAVSLENNIPNVDYEIIGEHKFVYLPTGEGQKYNISINGTDTGVFTLTDATITNNNVTQTQIFSSVPVTKTLTGLVNMGDTTSISLDTNGDGVIEQNLLPSSILNPTESLDYYPKQKIDDSKNIITMIPTSTNTDNAISISNHSSSRVVNSKVVIIQKSPVVDDKPDIDSYVFVPKEKSNILNTKQIQVKKIEKPKNLYTASTIQSSINLSNNFIILCLFGLFALSIIGKKIIK